MFWGEENFGFGLGGLLFNVIAPLGFVITIT
jgi:hypothetical protein